jgi:hypothetical protein
MCNLAMIFDNCYLEPFLTPLNNGSIIVIKFDQQLLPNIFGCCSDN